MTLQVTTTSSPPPQSPPALYSPLLGISNAYFLAQHQQPTGSPAPPIKTLLDEALIQQKKQQQQNSESPKRDNNSSPPIPNLLTQRPVSPSALPVASVLTPVVPEVRSKTGKASPNNPSQPLAKLSAYQSNDLFSSAPVRRYKQYTEQTLQQALKEITEGQSINRSSMKYNIPARTLRDWMKRLNIKSVFTHHSQKDGRSASADSSDCNSEEGGTANGSILSDSGSHTTDNVKVEVGSGQI